MPPEEGGRRRRSMPDMDQLHGVTSVLFLNDDISLATAGRRIWITHSLPLQKSGSRWSACCEAESAQKLWRQQAPQTVKHKLLPDMCLVPGAQLHISAPSMQGLDAEVITYHLPGPAGATDGCATLQDMRLTALLSETRNF